MFDSRGTKRAHRVHRTAEDALDRLVAAAENAGDAARAVQRRTHSLADDAGSSVASATDEARRRAGAAIDALAGRKPRMHWEWIAAAMVAGLAVGWFAAAAGSRHAVADHEQPREHAADDALDALAEPEY